jgi:hypothetical protein
LQAQGGQVSPSTHAGQAQPHPPPGTGFIWTQLPCGHGAVTHAIASATQPQLLATSLLQVVVSVCDAHGSIGVVSR